MTDEMKKFIEKYGTYKPMNNIALMQEQCDKLYDDLTYLYWFDRRCSVNGVYKLTDMIFPQMHPAYYEDWLSYFENRVDKAKRFISFFTGELREKLETMLYILKEKTDVGGLRYNWSVESLEKVLTKEELKMFKSFPYLRPENNPATEKRIRNLVNKYLEVKNTLDKAVELEHLPKKVEMLEKTMNDTLNKLKGQLGPIYSEWEREKQMEWERRKREDEEHNRWVNSEEYKQWQMDNWMAARKQMEYDRERLYWEGLANGSGY